MDTPRKECAAERVCHQQPVGQSNECRRHARLRSGEEALRAQAPSRGGGAGIGAACESACRRCAGSRRSAARLGRDCRTVPAPEHVWVDQGYTRAGKEWIEQHLRWTVEIVRHTPNPRGEWRPIGDFNDSATLRFEWVRLPAAPKRLRGVLPRRWVAEMGALWAGFSWFGQSRRLAKEYERLCATSEAMIYATMTRLMARRLACA
jgi:transposase